jgi:hypothetical protein
VGLGSGRRRLDVASMAPPLPGLRIEGAFSRPSEKGNFPTAITRTARRTFAGPSAPIFR